MKASITAMTGAREESCPRCGKKNPPASSNCVRCGFPLKGNAADADDTGQVFSETARTSVASGEYGGQKATVRQIHASSADDIACIESQLKRRMQFTHRSIPRMISIDVGNNGLSTVSEDAGGDALELLLKSNSLSAEEGVSIAEQLLQTIGWLHAVRPHPMAHGHINLNTVRFNRTTDRISLIDWGLPESVMSDTGGQTNGIVQADVTQTMSMLREMFQRISSYQKIDSDLLDAVLKLVELPVQIGSFRTAHEWSGLFGTLLKGSVGSHKLCKCGIDLPKSARFCGRCGRMVLETGENTGTPAIDIAVNYVDSVDAELQQSLKQSDYSSLQLFSLHQQLRTLNSDPGFQTLRCLDSLPLLERLPYQEKAALRVLRQMRGRALLADEVGLGKTIEAGLILKELITRGRILDDQKVLILCPGHVALQWQEELFDKFELFFPVYGENIDFTLAWQCPRLIAPYELLDKRNHAEEALDHYYDLLILDEAHLINNSERWRLLNTIMAFRKKYFLLLSATPIQNSLDDLYNIVSLLRPGHFDAQNEFRDRYQDPENPRKTLHVDELKKHLSSVMVRNRREEVDLEFPTRNAQTIPITLPPGYKDFYDRFQKEFSIGLRGKDNRRFMLRIGALVEAFCSSAEAFQEAVALLSRQQHLVRQVGKPFLDMLHAFAEEYPQDLPSRKADAAIRLAIERANCGEKVLVFSEFNATSRFLYYRFKNTNDRCFLYDEEATPEVNNQTLQNFRTVIGGAVLFCFGDAGVGLNLQFCRTLINFDIPWSPMKLEQRIGRLQRYGSSAELRRQGFENEIIIRTLIHKGTIEETIYEDCVEILSQVTDVIGKLETILGHVGDENDIRALIGDVFLDRQVEMRVTSEEDVGRQQTVSAMDQLRNTIKNAIEATMESLDDDVCNFSVDIPEDEY